jgi:SpoVK/Ycf46/Vps4 family AAA+-type ATPase
VAPTIEVGENNLDRIAAAVRGLTFDEVRHAIRRALAEENRFGPESIPALLEEKRLLISRSGVVEFIGDVAEIGHIGGLETLKKWVRERKQLFGMNEALAAEIVPKGVLMMGIPGCGKSLSAKAVAFEFGLPLYRFNMTEVFSGRHGPPAATFVQACRMVENLAPAVVWFDEIEMGISSADSTGDQGRIFAFFLTWMQEKAPGLFVAATANRIDLLPAEMIRKGRFDEIFFVDLPINEEKLEIFKIHLSRRGVDPSNIDLNGLLQFTKDWSGAEIEQCVISSLTRARVENRGLTWNDLIAAATGLVPLAHTMKEQINHIRQWAFNRAVRASKLAR